MNPVFSDLRQIYVVRSRSRSGDSATHADATATPAIAEIYHLVASPPAAYALAEDCELKSRDMVFVDPVPLVLTRVISLLLPSAQVVNLSRTPNIN